MGQLASRENYGSIDPKQILTDELCNAASKGKIDDIQRALDKGADVNQPDKYGMNAIHHCAIDGQFSAFKFLVENGADLDDRSADKSTPLILACASNSYLIVDYIIGKYRSLLDPEEVKIRVNQTNNAGMSALHFAYLIGDNRSIRALVAIGADKNLTDDKGRKPTDLAAERTQLFEDEKGV
eukprot:comp15009_c0_seq1/m.22264 comp15009_c0_seq1/g.22264  ORF comp15009_c0_seq1/g.22264 comp15009_c0_seq1/m.22264 type:complete len:182 (-) comp15009_c0_seq1:45-590(-)